MKDLDENRLIISSILNWYVRRHELLFIWEIHNYFVSKNVLSSNQFHKKNYPSAIVIKPSNIRIWIHDKDIGKLARVLWEGQGNRLRTEVSSNNKVKKFLDAVPSIMVS